MASMLLRVCVSGGVDGGGNDNDGARYSEYEGMHHSLTGRVQSPVRGTQCSQLLVSTEQGGRDQ